MTSKRYFITILILGALTALGPFSIDMYLPGFPAIASDLGTTTAQVSLSLSSFFIGIATGQLLYGPLLDRFGRKKPLYIGLLVYIAASLICALTTNIEVLIFVRFIQAVGSCAAGVASIVMVRDLFPVKDNAKVFSLLMLVLGSSPMIAPTVGGYLTSALGWQSVFVILAVLASLMLVSVRIGLPNQYKADPLISLRPRPILLGFLSVVKEPQFYTYAAVGAVSFSGLFAYVSVSPRIFMEIFKVSGEIYGWIFAFLSVGLIGSSQVNSLLLKKYKSERIIFMALIFQVFISILFLILSVYDFLGIAATIGFLFLYLCTLGFIAPNTSALSMAPFSKNAGSASSLMGTLQMTLGAISSIGVSIVAINSTVPLTVIMACASVLAFIILVIGRRKITTSKPRETFEEQLILNH